ncbi:MAG TPA: carboxymuconolactone decarboxylase family protein [Methanomassiliicoccales archaeon]
MKADAAVDELSARMGNFVPLTLSHIQKHHPDLAILIKDMDEIMEYKGALDKKTKRLIALACVSVRMCDDCIYPQAKVAKNFGAMREEIMEALSIAVLTGGVPTWSNAKHGISKLMAEWDEEDAKMEEEKSKPAPKVKKAAPKKKGK